MQTPPFVEAYLTRADWGADPLVPTAGHPINWAQVVGMVLHHTVMVMRDYDRDGFLNGDLDDIKRYMRVLQHVRPDLGDEVPYTDVLFAGSRPDTCVIAVGRGPGRTGAHTAGLNSTRSAIAVAGNTDADQPMTPGMVAGFRWLAAIRLADPEHAVAAIGHQQAPPYLQNGNNLNATGCPGKQGMSVLPQLQPPYRLEPADTAPTWEDPAMFTVRNADGIDVTYRIDDRRLVQSWVRPETGQRAPWEELVDGLEVTNLQPPLVAGQVTWVPVCAHHPDFDDQLLLLIQPRTGVRYEAHLTDDVARYLSSVK